MEVWYQHQCCDLNMLTQHHQLYCGPTDLAHCWWWWHSHACRFLSASCSTWCRSISGKWGRETLTYVRCPVKAHCRLTFLHTFPGCHTPMCSFTNEETWDFCSDVPFEGKTPALVSLIAFLQAALQDAQSTELVLTGNQSHYNVKFKTFLIYKRKWYIYISPVFSPT